MRAYCPQRSRSPGSGILLTRDASLSAECNQQRSSMAATPRKAPTLDRCSRRRVSSNLVYRQHPAILHRRHCVTTRRSHRIWITTMYSRARGFSLTRGACCAHARARRHGAAARDATDAPGCVNAGAPRTCTSMRNSASPRIQALAGLPAGIKSLTSRIRKSLTSQWECRVTTSEPTQGTLHRLHVRHDVVRGPA